MGADDGVRLRVNGRVEVDLWELYTLRRGKSRTITLPLREGLNSLHLEFFEWTGRADVSFQISNAVQLLADHAIHTSRKLFGLAEQRIAVLDRKLKDLETDLEEQAHSVEEVHHLLAAAQRELHGLREQMHDGFADVETDLEKLADSVEGSSHLIAKAQRGLHGLDEQMSTVFAELDALRREITLLASQQHSLEQSLDDMGQRVTQVEGRVDTLEEPTPPTGWEVLWHVMDAPGEFGVPLGTDSFPLNFNINYGYGPIYGENDKVGFKATTAIRLERQMRLLFSVSANNCFELYVNGERVLSHWGEGEPLRPASQSNRVLLDPGLHQLELRYYKWGGQGWISFSCR